MSNGPVNFDKCNYDSKINLIYWHQPLKDKPICKRVIIMFYLYNELAYLSTLSLFNSVQVCHSAMGPSAESRVPNCKKR